MSVIEECLFVSPGDRPRKLYAERALNLPLGAELITGNMWYLYQIFISPSNTCPVHLHFPALSTCMFSSTASSWLPFSTAAACVIPHINISLFYVCVCVFFFSDLLSTSSNSEGQDGMVGGHADCPFQRRIIPAHRLRPRRTHPEIFQVFIYFHLFFLVLLLFIGFWPLVVLLNHVFFRVGLHFFHDFQLTQWFHAVSLSKGWW